MNLREIRENMLRATSDQDINNMSKEQLQGELERINELNGIDTNDIF